MTEAAYAVIVEERHTDVDVLLFADADAAVAGAKEVVADYNRSGWEVDEELNEFMARAGWLYYCAWGESNHVHVVKREIK